MSGAPGAVHRTRQGPVFFYADGCPRCGPTLREIAPLFAASDCQLYVRKPTPAELSTPGFGFPALLVPRGCLGFSDTALLVGDRLGEALRRAGVFG